MLKGINFESISKLEVGQVATISATEGLVTVHRISSEQVMNSLTVDGNLVAVVVFNLSFLKFLETIPENKEEEQYWINKVLYNDIQFEESGIVMRSFVNDHGNKSVVMKTTTDIQDGNLHLKKDTAIMMAEFNIQYLETIKETFKK
jgi:hypothetical protein